MRVYAIGLCVVVCAVMSLVGCEAARPPTSTASSAVPTSVALNGGSPPAQFSTPAGSPATSSTPAASPTVGTIALGKLASYVVEGAASRYRGSVDVWTPPGYSPAKATEYPVLVAFHGWPGSPAFLETHTGLIQQVAAAASSRRLAWPIVVIPQWGVGVDTECTNGTPSLQIETWLAHDLPVWVAKNFRVRRGPASWAGFGYSAGAWCARMLTMRHPSVFGAEIDLSGYSQPSFEPPYVPFTPSSTRARGYNLIQLAEKAPPKVSIYLVSSITDRESYPSTLAFQRAAHAPLHVTWVVAGGGHSMSLWRPHISDGLSWLGRTLAGFRP